MYQFINRLTFSLLMTLCHETQPLLDPYSYLSMQTWAQMYPTIYYVLDAGLEPATLRM